MIRDAISDMLIKICNFLRNFLPGGTEHRYSIDNRSSNFEDTKGTEMPPFPNSGQGPKMRKRGAG